MRCGGRRGRIGDDAPFVTPTRPYPNLSLAGGAIGPVGRAGHARRAPHHSPAAIFSPRRPPMRTLALAPAATTPLSVPGPVRGRTAAPGTVTLVRQPSRSGAHPAWSRAAITREVTVGRYTPPAASGALDVPARGSRVIGR